MTRRTKGLLSFALLMTSLPLVAGEVREYAIILQDAPVAARISSRKELRSQAALDARRNIESAQQELRRALAGRNVKVVGSVNTLLNAVFVRVAEEDAPGLATLPGVRGVARTRQVKLHMDKALPLVNAPAAWQTIGGVGNAGAGIKIGVIDTGIDQNHPGFKDDSLTPPPPVCSIVDLSGATSENKAMSPGECAAFTNKKVILARSYVPMIAVGYDPTDPAPTSAPDDASPRDRVGHGTAAAMVAAGVQTTGPLATISGVAPKAFLGNYKIFGSPGINDGSTEPALVKALEDALNDHMDIVTMSLGFPAWYDWADMGAACDNPDRPGFDPKAPCEVAAQAVQNAVTLGMAVAVSAGNDGDYGLLYSTNGTVTMNTIHTPGIAPDAITVGASRNAHIWFSSVGLSAADAPSNLRTIQAKFGDGPAPAQPVNGVLRDAGYACTTLTGSFSGAIALIQRGSCTFATKLNNAQAAGAAGAIIFDNQTEPIFTPSGLAGTGIPAAIVSNGDGTALQGYLESHPGAQATMDATLKGFDDPGVNTMADFSSRGPAIGFGNLKPELVAVGTEIYTAAQRFDPNGELYDPSGFAVASGTSFSAPMVAGALAVVKQQHPNWTVKQLRSAVVNTADALGSAPVTSAGAGKLNVDAAARANVTVDPATISFGQITAGSFAMANRLDIVNPTGAPLSIAVQPLTPETTAHVTVTQATVPAGQTFTSIRVILGGTLPNPGSYQGFITISGGAVTLRVPYLYMLGDGVPYDAVALYQGSFTGPVGDHVGLVLLRAIDKYGVPVVGAPVTWQSVSGGVYVNPTSQGGADTQTDKYGEAGANIIMGAGSEQEIDARIGSGSQPVTFPFLGTVRNQPSVSAGGIVDSASGRAMQGFAPGSYITLYGSGLSDSTILLSSLFPQNFAYPLYLPISLGGVSVSFDVPGAGISVPAHFQYVSPGQVNVLIPWELAGQTSAEMKVTAAGIRSAVYTVPLNDYAPAAFENPLGSGYALAQDAATWSVITTSNKARKGQWVVVYMNGLGPVDSPPASGELTPSDRLVLAKTKPAVTLGGRSVDVYSTGYLTPNTVGLYQVNVFVPADMASGDQPLAITAGEVAAKVVKLPVE